MPRTENAEKRNSDPKSDASEIRANLMLTISPDTSGSYKTYAGEQKGQDKNDGRTDRKGTEGKNDLFLSTR